MRNLLTILISILMNTVGQILLKIGSQKLKVLSLAPSTLFSDLLRLFQTPEIMLGLLLFGAGFLLWVKVLTRNELSYAYPMVSLSYVLVVIASYFLFNEPLTITKGLGVGVIILGVVFINK